MSSRPLSQARKVFSLQLGIIVLALTVCCAPSSANKPAETGSPIPENETPPAFPLGIQTPAPWAVLTLTSTALYAVTPTGGLPAPVAASEEVKQEAREILQAYYANLPYLDAAISVPYHEYYGCLGTRDVGGLVDYYSSFSRQTAADAFEAYFQQGQWDWQLITDNGLAGTMVLTSYTARRTGDGQSAPAGLTAAILELPEDPRSNAPQGQVARRTEIIVQVRQIESPENARLLDLENTHFSDCLSGWWLWLGP